MVIIQCMNMFRVYNTFKFEKRQMGGKCVVAVDSNFDGTNSVTEMTLMNSNI